MNNRDLDFFNQDKNSGEINHFEPQELNLRNINNTTPEVEEDIDVDDIIASNNIKQIENVSYATLGDDNIDTEIDEDILDLLLDKEEHLLQLEDEDIQQLPTITDTTQEEEIEVDHHQPQPYGQPTQEISEYPEHQEYSENQEYQEEETIEISDYKITEPTITTASQESYDLYAELNNYDSSKYEFMDTQWLEDLANSYKEGESILNTLVTEENIPTTTPADNPNNITQETVLEIINPTLTITEDFNELDELCNTLKENNKIEKEYYEKEAEILSVLKNATTAITTDSKISDNELLEDLKNKELQLENALEEISKLEISLKEQNNINSNELEDIKQALASKELELTRLKETIVTLKSSSKESEPEESTDLELTNPEEPVEDLDPMEHVESEEILENNEDTIDPTEDPMEILESSEDLSESEDTEDTEDLEDIEDLEDLSDIEDTEELDEDSTILITLSNSFMDNNELDSKDVSIFTDILVEKFNNTISKVIELNKVNIIKKGRRHIEILYYPIINEGYLRKLIDNSYPKDFNKEIINSGYINIEYKESVLL